MRLILASVTVVVALLVLVPLPEPIIQPVQAAACAFRAAGTNGAGTGDVTPGLPAGTAENDLLMLLVETANEAVSAPDGTWTEFTHSPQGTGAAAGSTATRLTAFWKRAGPSESAPTVTDAGDHTLAVIDGFSGVITSGDPFETTSGDVQSSVSTTFTVPTITTTFTNMLIVFVASSHLDTNQTGDWTNANLTSITATARDSSTTTGNDGTIFRGNGVFDTPGSVGASVMTAGASSLQGRLHVGLKCTDSSGGGGASSNQMLGALGVGR